MKHVFLFSIAMGCLVFFNAQCSIDYDFGEATFGVSPDPVLGEAFQAACVNQPYMDVLHLLFPATAAGIDETYPPTLPLDSVIVADDVVNGENDYSGVVFVDIDTEESFFASEIGLSLAYNNNGDSPNASTFLGANQYCAVIQGVPTRAGQYRIDIDVIAWATIFTPFNVPYTFESFTLSVEVECTATGGCTDSEALNFDPSATLEDGTCIYCENAPPTPATQPFFSEYVEGWSNNKALEIFNPTGVSIDLSDYQIERYSNGATAAEENQKVQLSGMLEANDVVVCVLDKQNPDGVDFEAPVWDELAAVADLWLCPVYSDNSAMYYNGNDGLVLRQISTNDVVDVFGKIGEDPGSLGWADVTQNHTLVRKSSVASGDVNAIDDFAVFDQWDTLAVNTFGFLGFHQYCFETGTSFGCTDPDALNYDPDAMVDDGQCLYFAFDCLSIGGEPWQQVPEGIYPSLPSVHVQGNFDAQDLVLHLPAVIVEPVSGSSYAVESWDNLVVAGLPQGMQIDAEIEGMQGATQLCISYSGVPEELGSFELLVSGAMTISVFGSPFVLGEFGLGHPVEVVPNPEGIVGCTYPNASNYLAIADIDSGSCVFEGCTNLEAVNYTPLAMVDDGTCEFPECNVSCPADLDADGSIGTGDLLMLLSSFGALCVD